MKIRYMKVIRDLTSDYAKNLMLVLAIAIGVFGIGSILGGYSVLNREMAANYKGTVPASATIEVESAITKELLDSVKRLPGIKDAERHATLTARMKVGEKWYPLLLFVIDDFTDKRTNKIYSITGATVPEPGAMLVERTAFTVMQAKEGDEIIVKTPHGSPKSVRLSGTVHDPGLAPAWQQQAGYGYITLSTLHWLGETQGFDQLRMLVDDHTNSTPHITQKAEAVATWLEKNGHHVHEIQVPPPGKHPHQGQMNAVLSIFTVFSFLILVLGSILVATSMATLMVKQVRQIGVMKTIGASAVQIIGLYAFMIMMLCLVALLIAVPLSRIAAFVFYTQIAVLLNLEIMDNSIPYWVPLLQVASGIVIPMMAASIPVIRGSIISVRTALDNYGVARKNVKNETLTAWLSDFVFISETFKLSIRNVFRLRSRLAMTLGLLAAGGAMFMTALNVSEAWDENLGKIYLQRLYDLEIRLNQATRADSIISGVRAIEGVKTAEAWNYSSCEFTKEKNTYQVTRTYPDKGHGSFVVLALPVPSPLLSPSVVDGRWLHSATANEVVLNQQARHGKPGVKVGDQVQLTIEDSVSTWKVIGFTDDVGSPATAYVSTGAFSRQVGSRGMSNMLRIAYHDRSRENASKKNREVEALLEKMNISVSVTIPVWVLRNAVAAHMRVLVNSLMAMAVLMAIVGTLGLTSAMSVNVMERTREIGVMRAIGATPRTISNLIIWEGLLTGGLSLFPAILLSIALSFYLGRFIGGMAFGTPLSLAISFSGVLIWIGIIVAGSYAATFFPARRANRISTREALAYE
jgi:putative ABC transport system permease protein